MLEHLNKWSPQHSHMRANPVDVEIPTELSQMGYLKTLVQHVGHNERSIASAPRRAVQWKRRTNGGRRKPTRSRGAQPRGDVKRNRTGEEGATEDMEEDVMELISQVHEKTPYSSSHACGTWRRRRAACFHTEKQRNRDRNVRRKQSRQRTVNTSTMYGKRKPAHLVLHAESRARWKRRGVTTLLIPPPALIPMCPDRGFWRPLWLCGDAEERNLACRHAESLPLVRENLQIKTGDQAAHLLVYRHLSETHCAERSARSEGAKQRRKKRGKGRRQQRRKKRRQVVLSCL